MMNTDKRNAGRAARTIVLAVTVDMSLGLIEGFASHLARHGWDVHVISGPGPRLDRLGAVGIRVHPVGMRRDPAPVSDLRALIGWLRILMRVRPDVVMSGTPKAGILGMLAAWILGIPDRVYVVRGLRLETSHGALRCVLTVLERLAFSLCTRAVAVGPSLRDELVRLRLVRSQKVCVLGNGSSNGVDAQRFHPRGEGDPQTEDLRNSLGILPTVPTIGFVGRLNRDKGLDTISAALDILEEEDARLQFLVVGGQDGGALLSRQRLSENIRVVHAGQVADTSAYYGLIDVLCLPTRREGFPNVILEAAASEVPSITTNATGAVDAVIDEVTGLVVQMDNPDELARAINRLLSDVDFRVALGKNARRWAIDNFDQAAVWERTIEFLNRGPRRGRIHHADCRDLQNGSSRK